MSEYKIKARRFDRDADGNLHERPECHKISPWRNFIRWLMGPSMESVINAINCTRKAIMEELDRLKEDMQLLKDAATAGATAITQLQTTATAVNTGMTNVLQAVKDLREQVEAGGTTQETLDAINEVDQAVKDTQGLMFDMNTHASDAQVSLNEALGKEEEATTGPTPTPEPEPVPEPVSGRPVGPRGRHS